MSYFDGALEEGERELCDAGLYLVLLQGDIVGFSWFVSVQGKARLAANGRSPLQEAQHGHGR